MWSHQARPRLTRANHASTIPMIGKPLRPQSTSSASDYSGSRAPHAQMLLSGCWFQNREQEVW